MGNDPTKAPRPSSRPLLPALPEEMMRHIDPKLRPWLDGSKYTATSIFREEADDPPTTGQTDTASPTDTSISAQPGSGTIVTVRCDNVSKGDKYKDKDAEIIHLEAIPPVTPIYASRKYRRLFPPELLESREIRYVSDPTTILKILDQLQQRLNAASIVVSTQQDENNIKIVSQKVKCWNVLNRLATLGLDLNLVEMHLSEIQAMRSAIDVTRNRMLDLVKRTQYLLDMIPLKERSPELVPPVDLAPHLVKSRYLYLNYYKETPYYRDMESDDIQALERQAESFWVYEIIPFWNYAIGEKRAQVVWRKGIPPKVRAYVWKMAIGNKLKITREQFEEFRATLDLSSNDTENIPTPTLDDNVTIHIIADNKTQAADEEAQLSSETEKEEPPHTETPDIEESTASPSTTNEVENTEKGEIKAEGEEISECIVELMPNNSTLEAIATQLRATGALNDIIEQSRIESIADAAIGDSEPEAREHSPPGPPETPSPVESGPQINPPVRRKPRIITRRSSILHLKKQIELDLRRTLPKLSIFTNREHPSYTDALAILLAVAHFKPHIGYLQGMSYLAAMLLMFMDAADAFICLMNLLESHLFMSLCKVNLTEFAKHAKLYSFVFEQNLPALKAHFAQLQISEEQYLFDWYLTMFTKPLPLRIAARIWDCFLLEGPSFIHVAATGLLKLYEHQLRRLSFEGVLDFLRKLPEDINEEALFAAIDSVAVAPYLHSMLQKVDQLHAAEST